jgi:hypothetical protein
MQTIAFPVAIVGNNFSNEWATLMIKQEEPSVVAAAGMESQTGMQTQREAPSSIPQSVAISQELAEVRRLVAALTHMVQLVLIAASTRLTSMQMQQEQGNGR